MANTTAGPIGVGVYVEQVDNGQAVGRAYGGGALTPHRGEIESAILVLRLTPRGSMVTLHTDSRYVRRVMSQLDAWAAQGWKRCHKGKLQPVPHRGQVQYLHELLRHREVVVKAMPKPLEDTCEPLASELALAGLQWARTSVVAATSPYQVYLASGAGLHPLPETAAFVPFNGDPDVRGLDLTFGSAEDTDAESLRTDKWNRHRAWSKGRSAYDRAHGNLYHSGKARRLTNIQSRVGSHHDFLARYQRQMIKAGRALRRDDPASWTIEDLQAMHRNGTDFRMLRCAWEKCVAGGGDTAGVDGLTFGSFSDRKRNELLRELQGQLRYGRWRPQPVRRILVPKPGDRGVRPIDIPTVADRVVESAMNLALTPVLEPLMHDSSVGFRPGLSVQHGLARLKVLIEDYGFGAAATVDLSKAFTRVPKRRLADIVRQLVPSKHIVRVVNRIIGRPLPQGEGVRQHCGLAQGGPLSPLLLNLYLTKLLDYPWAEVNPDLPMVRYADDLVLLAREPGQVRTAVERLRRQLEPHGLVFRPDSVHVADVTRGEKVEVWGYKLTLDRDNLRIDLSETTYANFAEQLRHQGNIADQVGSILQGFLRWAGPVYPLQDPETRERWLLRLGEIAHAQSACLGPLDEVRRLWWLAGIHFIGLSSGMRLVLDHTLPRARELRAPQRVTFPDQWADRVRHLVEGLTTIET